LVGASLALLARRVISVFVIYLFQTVLHELEAELRDVTYYRRFVSQNAFAILKCYFIGLVPRTFFPLMFCCKQEAA
jgi:hypothetical protein